MHQYIFSWLHEYANICINMSVIISFSCYFILRFNVYANIFMEIYIYSVEILTKSNLKYYIQFVWPMLQPVWYNSNGMLLNILIKQFWKYFIKMFDIIMQYLQMFVCNASCIFIIIYYCLKAYMKCSNKVTFNILTICFWTVISNILIYLSEI